DPGHLFLFPFNNAQLVLSATSPTTGIIVLGPSGQFEVDDIGHTFGVTLLAGANIFLQDIKTNGGSITAVAGQGVFSSSTPQWDTGGGAITMIGGANFAYNGSTISVTGRSGLGGDVDFVTDPLSSLSVGGASITLAAFSSGGPTPTGGQIRVPQSINVLTNGGSVSLYGEGGVSAGAIDTTGSSAAGNIVAQAGVPSTTPVTITSANGALSGFTTGALTAQDVSKLDLTAPGASITVAGDKKVMITGIVDASGAQNGGAVSIVSNSNSEPFSINASIGHNGI